MSYEEKVALDERVDKLTKKIETLEAKNKKLQEKVDENAPSVTTAVASR